MSHPEGPQAQQVNALLTSACVRREVGVQRLSIQYVTKRLSYMDITLDVVSPRRNIECDVIAAQHQLQCHPGIIPSITSTQVAGL